MNAPQRTTNWTVTDADNGRERDGSDICTEESNGLAASINNVDLKAIK